jgi:hypothetical protein
MQCKLRSLLCLSAALSTAIACAQAPSPAPSATPNATTTTTPVSYVYVSYVPAPNSSNARKVAAFKAWPNGSLTAISGSPFNDNVGAMAVNGKYLMAASNTGANIEAYLIESGGALAYKTSTDYGKFNNSSSDCGDAVHVSFDHTGSDLYLVEGNGTSSCSNNVVGSFAVNKYTGALNYLGTASTGTFPGVTDSPTITSNNLYAYVGDGTCMYWGLYGFKRASNGFLNNYSNNSSYKSPAPPPGARMYLPHLGAADPTNHVAFAMQPANPPDCASGAVKLATYTVASNGYLSTTSTYQNMPNLAITSPLAMKMAPSGKLLAVGGMQGLQVFHFNGANPITHYTNLMITEPITEVFWDNNNHLYAITLSYGSYAVSGKLYVFTVTPTGWSQAPGSPHAISAPSDLIVQPLPR